MPGTTAVYALRYPLLSETPSGPTQIENLARDVDAALANRTFIRFAGQTERAADGGTLTLPAETEVAIRAITTTIVNNQAMVHALWYGFTLSGTQNTKVLIRIRRTDINGPTLSAWYTPNIEPTDTSGPIGGGTTFAFDPTPGVNPSYVLTMQRAPATVGNLRLVPGTTSPYAVITAEQKGTVK